MLKTKAACRLTEVKTSDEMSFSGYGSVFGNIDCYGDVVERGAFSKTIASFKADGRWPAMLLQHGGGFCGTAQDMTPVGVWTEMREDEHGLYVEGKLADTERGRELYTLMKMEPRPAIDGMSIGFFTTDFYDEQKDGDMIRHITGVELVELSLVTFPANGEARVADVKSDTQPSIRDAERALRDAGFSRSDAKKILAKGFSSCLRDAGEGLHDELVEAIRRNISALTGKEN